MTASELIDKLKELEKQIDFNKKIIVAELDEWVDVNLVSVAVSSNGRLILSVGGYTSWEG